MKKIILIFLLLISFGSLTSQAQIQTTPVRIPRDRTSTIQRLPDEIRSIADQVQLPQADAENRLKALGIQNFSSSFTLSPENMKVDGKGAIDFVNPILVVTTGSLNNPYLLSPVAFMIPTGPTVIGSWVGLKIKNNQPGSRYLVDVKTTPNADIYVVHKAAANFSPGWRGKANSNGHLYFVLTAFGNGDVLANISGMSVLPGGKFVFFGLEISKLN